MAIELGARGEGKKTKMRSESSGNVQAARATASHLKAVKSPEEKALFPQQTVQSRRDNQRKCDEPEYAPGSACPEACPYLAEENGTARTCFFRCVPAEMCGEYPLKVDESMAVAAKGGRLMCQRCKATGCDKCKFGSQECVQCMAGFHLWHDGTCKNIFRYVEWSMYISLAIVAILFLSWIMELALRRSSNDEGLEQGIIFRHNTVVAMPEGTPAGTGIQRQGKAQLYPLFVNLMNDPNIGGPALCLHMRFQLYLILWPAILGAAYVVMAYVLEPDMMKLPQWNDNLDLCGLMRWGERNIQDVKVVRLAYLVFSYVFTLTSAFVFAVSNELAFQNLDNNSASIKDYTAYMTGLPKFKGGVDAEEFIHGFVEQCARKEVVGVSICWNYHDYEDDIIKAVEQDMEDMEEEVNPKWALQKSEQLKKAMDAGVKKPWDVGGARFFPMLYNKFDNAWRKYLWGIPFDRTVKDEDYEQNISTILEKLESSGKAWIVFDSENDRDSAIKAFAETQFLFPPDDVTNGQQERWQATNKRIHLKKREVEPSTVNWQNYKGSGPLYRLIAAIVGVITMLALWIVFYVPFSKYMAEKLQAKGRVLTLMDPDYYFVTIVVLMGNQFMYLVCDLASTYVQFELEDVRQVCYNALYSCAVFLGSFIDLAVNGYFSYLLLVRQDVHTSDGRAIQDLGNISDIILSFPMQRELGETLYLYAFPATFLISFIGEAIGCVGFVGWISQMIVRSRPEFRGRKAEKAMSYFLEMNMCRYSDLVFNALLATLVNFVSGGTTWSLFRAMAFSHVFVYCYDHWRVIRVTPQFCYSSQSIDRSSQVLMVLPCAIILVAVCFWVSQIYDVETGDAVLWTCVAVLVHVVVHVWGIWYLVPWASEVPHKASTDTYAAVASKTPASFFTKNPVHCLRSKHLKKDDPPCGYFIPGKGHLIRANPSIGQYYQSDDLLENIVAEKTRTTVMKRVETIVQKSVTDQQ